MEIWEPKPPGTLWATPCLLWDRFTFLHCFVQEWWGIKYVAIARVERDGTRAETRFRLSPKWTSPFKSVGGRQFSRLLAAEVCASA